MLWQREILLLPTDHGLLPYLINQKLCAFKKEKGHCKDVKDNTNHDGSENENDTLIISPLEGIETMIEEAVLIADVEFDCDLEEEEEEIKDDYDDE
jgi:hypothetical protein